jgi:hypothetical protein
MPAEAAAWPLRRSWRFRGIIRTFRLWRVQVDRYHEDHVLRPAEECAYS